MTASTLPSAVEEVLSRRRGAAPERALLVGVSGIDGSGKGFVGERIAAAVARAGCKAAVIAADGWLVLPARRFDAARPAEHFYEHGLRLDELFESVVLPLRDRRSCDVVADFAEETATRFRPRRIRHEDVAVLLVEGIFLFKRRYRSHFDLACWIDCTFETALERAIRRAQEGLPPAETISAYQTIYFPAQRIHLERDDPRRASDLRIENDARLGAVVAPGRRERRTRRPIAAP